MKLGQVSRLFSSIILCQLAGAIGSMFTTPSIATWYAELNKPSFNPPNWIFGPVWFTLYVLMGIAFYLVWDGKKRGHVLAMISFCVQLALNALWSIIFFGMHLTLLAFLEIALMWAAIVYTMLLFNKISRTAVYLMLPYLLWVSFAAFLNLNLWVLNR